MKNKLIGALALVALVAPAAAAAEPRIVGGTVAPPGAYPAVVSIAGAGSEGSVSHGCGGTLVDSTTVLTAAHCLLGLTPDDVDVVAGRERLDDTATGTRIDVERYALHPGTDDAALIRLAQPAPQAPVALATSAEAALYAPGASATVVGWGTKRESAGALSNHLREVDVPVVSDRDCRRAYRGFGGLRMDRLLCAGAQDKDTCSGDSGGPLFVRDAGGALLQAGITSFGRGCGRARFPGVYVEVPAIIDFARDPEPVWAPIPAAKLAKVTGERAVGETLTCDEGVWDGEDIRFRYLWTAGFDPRTRSRERIWAPGAGIAGKRVSCQVLAVTDGGAVELVSKPVRIRGGGGE